MPRTEGFSTISRAGNFGRDLFGRLFVRTKKVGQPCGHFPRRFHQCVFPFALLPFLLFFSSFPPLLFFSPFFPFFQNFRELGCQMFLGCLSTSFEAALKPKMTTDVCKSPCLICWLCALGVWPPCPVFPINRR